MDSSPPLLSYGLGVQQYHWSCPSSDSEFYNVSSPETVSPSYSCMDSFSPSSSSLPRSSSSTGPRSSTHTGGTKASVSPSSSDEAGIRAGSGVRPARKSRSKNPSKQRESASEKEKLRMRDLTKALHHLRTYLPPSVAPAGQTLTKIETLRLTIRYISHLSAQLGLSKDDTCQKREMDISDVSEYQTSSQGSPRQSNISSGCWRDVVGVGAGVRAGQQQTLHCHTPTYPLQNARMDSYPLSCEMEVCAYDDSFNSSMDSLLESPEYSAEACQVYNHKDVHYQNMTQQFWI